MTLSIIMPNMESTRLLVTPARTLIKKSWGAYKPLWKKFVLLQLIPYIPIVGTILLVVIIALVGGIMAAQEFGADGGVVTDPFLANQPLALLIVFGIVALAGLLATMFSVIASQIATIYLARDRDPKPGVWERFWGAKGVFWGYVWVGVLAFVPIAIGWLLFLVPGIILGVMFTFVWFVYLFEGQKGLQALRASRQLVRGFWWTVFARLLVLILLIWLVMLPAYIPILGLFWQIVVQFVVGPITLLFTFHLWEELRGLQKSSSGAVDGM